MPGIHHLGSASFKGLKGFYSGQSITLAVSLNLHEKEVRMHLRAFCLSSSPSLTFTVHAFLLAVLQIVIRQQLGTSVLHTPAFHLLLLVPASMHEAVFRFSY